jgi:hypothetical protein
MESQCVWLNLAEFILPVFLYISDQMRDFSGNRASPYPFKTVASKLVFVHVSRLVIMFYFFWEGVLDRTEGPCILAPLSYTHSSQICFNYCTVIVGEGIQSMRRGRLF